nr:fusion protein of ribosomal protein L5 and ribosomal protein S8 [Dinophyceae sp. MRD-151]
MRQRLKRFYREYVIPQLYKQFQYRNIHQVPYAKKVIINQGLEEINQNSKILEPALLELTTIAAQRGVVTRARKAIAGFKIREKTPVGLKVTLRGERIYAFLDRIINLALPRIRDFQGVNPKSFDGRGNYSLGLEEQLIFPEISYDNVDLLVGIDLSIVTTSCNNKEGLFFLKRIGMPFRNDLLLNFMTKDIFRETLTSIRNALLVKKSGVEVKKTQMTKALSKILCEEGLIDKISEVPYSKKTKKDSKLFLSIKYRGSERASVITNLQMASRSGLRFYTNYKEIPIVFGGLGLVILSTSQGLITDREARFRKLGGEVVCFIWLSVVFYFYFIYENSFFGEENL